jgi:hypothetical protein
VELYYKAFHAGTEREPIRTKEGIAAAGAVAVVVAAY